jgi:hypothetical protein
MIPWVKLPDHLPFSIIDPAAEFGCKARMKNRRGGGKNPPAAGILT